MVSAFATLGTTEKLSSDTEGKIEAFVCQLYEPGTNIVDVGELRWRLFTKNVHTRVLPSGAGCLYTVKMMSCYVMLCTAQKSRADCPHVHLMERCFAPLKKQ